MRLLLCKLTQLGKNRPALWLTGWIIWFISLWLLSSGNPAPKNLPTTPHLDKIAHFGFFFGGAGLLSAWINHNSFNISTRRNITFTTFVGAIVGMLDEYHQSFTPGRTGNDVFDWLADVSGSFAGACVMICLLKATSAWNARQKKESSSI